MVGLHCRASGKLANLSIHSTANACITHRQGNLTVEVTPDSCPALPATSPVQWLTIDVAQVLSEIVGALSVVQACSLSCMGTGLNHLCAPIVTLASERSLYRRSAPAASAGVLNVVETWIKVSTLTCHAWHAGCVWGDGNALVAR